jgi:hypothetical protein
LEIFEFSITLHDKYGAVKAVDEGITPKIGIEIAALAFTLPVE